MVAISHMIIFFGFYQLYTLHAFTGNGQQFPCVYGLLTNKRQETYERFLTQLGGNPIEVLVDYERAAKNALEHVFPDAEVKGCFFHLAQNVYRQVWNFCTTVNSPLSRTFPVSIKPTIFVSRPINKLIIFPLH